MNIGKTFRQLCTVIAALLLLSFSTYASNDEHADKAGAKPFAFGTKSKEARDYVAQAVRKVEFFEFGDSVADVVKKAVEADPDFAFAHYLLGVMLPQQDGKLHLDKAAELAKNAPDSERRYVEAILLLRSQKVAEAIAGFEPLSKEYPEERMVHMILGQAYMSGGKFDQAKGEFEKAIQIDGSTPRAYAFLGNSYLFKEDYAKAREYYKIAHSKKEEGSAPFLPSYGQAYAYVYEGDYDSALKVLYAYREEYDKSPGFSGLPAVFIWNSIARLLLESGRAEEAIKAYEKGYETVPGSSMNDDEKIVWLGRLHHGKGRSLSKLGRHEEAWKEAELIKKMIEDNGEKGKQYWPSYHYIAGYLKLEGGEFPQAVEHLKQTDLSDAFHKLLLARAYDKVGNHADAQKLYKEIVDSTQNNIERALSYNEAKKKLKS